MRNRANTPPKDDSAFINGGTAGLTVMADKITKPKSKAKPVSISFADENLRSIDNTIREEMNNSGLRVNRSDVVRAAVMAFESLSLDERSSLIQKAKMQ
ncbi:MULTISPECIES: hypothetical protein [Erwiniaceae]|uniref:hypothetical protein n=1 Tax=Erwinia billingiae TaxID=182337 RepID=UPI0012471A6F|nr:hypothetical protein [Erwinia billingiae]MCX0498983.1 hypothetical protein [Erwinia billingiae]QEW34560.1 hypothetical protein D0N50_22865 [Erwinia billingiae]